MISCPKCGEKIELEFISNREIHCEMCNEIWYEKDEKK